MRITSSNSLKFKSTSRPDLNKKIAIYYISASAIVKRKWLRGEFVTKSSRESSSRMRRRTNPAAPLPSAPVKRLDRRYLPGTAKSKYVPGIRIKIGISPPPAPPLSLQPCFARRVLSLKTIIIKICPYMFAPAASICRALFAASRTPAFSRFPVLLPNASS